MKAAGIISVDFSAAMGSDTLRAAEPGPHVETPVGRV
jgi:hypothetical protein